MSDYRDPRDPVHRDPLYTDDPVMSERRAAGGYSSGMAWGWIIGLILLVGIIVFAFSSGDGTRVAQNEATPPASKTEPMTPPAAKTPAPAPAPAQKAPGQ